MSNRLVTGTLMVVCVVFATHSFAEPVTVKRGDSNTSDRMGGGGGAKGAGGAKTTTVKSSKSNTSDRMGGGGGAKGAGSAAKTINSNSGRPNN